MNLTVDASTSAKRDADVAWEQAYLRFETPDQEQRKFVARLRLAGAEKWRRDAKVLDLFSGRGGCANALYSMGFREIVSLDLSPRLLRAGANVSGATVADCRVLPIATRSVDVATVHGGLHHLPLIPDDLASTLREVARVLKPDGVLLAVEPWRTPFLNAVHWVCGLNAARTLMARIDALATMIELERSTYENWLARGPEILTTFDRFFVRARTRTRWGKLHYVGSPRAT